MSRVAQVDIHLLAIVLPTRPSLFVLGKAFLSV